MIQGDDKKTAAAKALSSVTFNTVSPEQILGAPGKIKEMGKSFY